jgi:hypothetical protein
LLPPDPPVESKPVANGAPEDSKSVVAEALQVTDEKKVDASDSNK